MGYTGIAFFRIPADIIEAFAETNTFVGID